MERHQDSLMNVPRVMGVIILFVHLKLSRGFELVDEETVNNPD